jgi:hypothetical protein
MAADLYFKEMAALLRGVIWLTRENLNLPKKPKKSKNIFHFSFRKCLPNLSFFTQIREPVQIYLQSSPFLSNFCLVMVSYIPNNPILGESNHFFSFPSFDNFA